MAMESFKDEDFGGLMPKITYSKTDHEGSFTGRIVQVKEDGTFIPRTNFYSPGREKMKLLK
jgi:dihydroorotate dehydrogenase